MTEAVCRQRAPQNTPFYICVLEPELTDKEFRRNWARLIQ